MDNISWSQVDLIREVFHYQSRFEGSTMVFKIDYPVTEDAGFPALVKDLALLAKTGFKVVIVPGVRENIDAVLKQHEIDTNGYVTGDSLINDMPVRITTSQTISYVEMAAFNVASKFMTFLSGSRVDAIIGNFVRARGLGVINGIDTEHTGAVDKIYADSLTRVLNLGMIPILPCIGWSPSGKPYNVSSDEIALAVSEVLGAVKLFIICAQDGQETKTLNIPETLEKRANGSLVRLTPQQAQAFISANSEPKQGEDEEIRRQYMRRFRLAFEASKAGVHRVHIVDGREGGSVLKELYSNLGVGTMIYTDEYDSVRGLHSRDLPDILRLMEPLMQRGVLIRRNPEQIQEKKGDFSVLEIDGSIRACGALHDFGEAQGEIAAVATDPMYTDLGLGRRIVGYLIEKARKSKMRRVFVLTTQSQDWFESLGFREASVDSLPEQKRKVYDRSRKSKVFALDI
ncbi:MAG: amino-acid N-acetyltransferase [Treponema sp.]|jgi:amino-acid N-acetyltransferase|nr:amino-acid N-acetyltransferase [Treponema sp.]